MVILREHCKAVEQDYNGSTLKRKSSRVVKSSLAHSLNQFR